MNRIASLLILLFCCSVIPLSAQQSLSIGLSYSHEPQWGTLLPLAGFDDRMSNKSLGVRYQRPLARLEANLEFQYTFSGYGYESRLAFGRTPSPREQEMLDEVQSGWFPNGSTQHQIAVLLQKEWPRKSDSRFYVGAGLGPLVRLGRDSRSWTYDHGTWVEGYFDTRTGLDMALTGRLHLRFAMTDRWSLVLAGQWDQYLLASKRSNLIGEVEVSRQTGHLGVFCRYHF
ncbi:MAG: hypothetical protein AAFN10_10630 [Bacteroidota bacterium]